MAEAQGDIKDRSAVNTRPRPKYPSLQRPKPIHFRRYIEIACYAATLKEYKEFSKPYISWLRSSVFFRKFTDRREGDGVSKTNNGGNNRIDSLTFRSGNGTRNTPNMTDTLQTN
ncbi:hypothetical protein JTE90_014657 [Oedothorax gibbosus]|uniref:Uncharacterized protein n=1 Tax=Oedothorax gibbosus TaxID=931172 RepID=A0AAV6VB48_9ARAC|nr:hypothetical protein JTE90_014657 [Oedothorax gibbosus]